MKHVSSMGLYPGYICTSTEGGGVPLRWITVWGCNLRGYSPRELYIKWIIWRYVSRLCCVQLTLRIKAAWGVRWAESSPLTATLKEFFSLRHTCIFETLWCFCFLAFVALWYLHTWFNSLTELVDYWFPLRVVQQIVCMLLFSCD